MTWLVRDVMMIGVPVCRATEACGVVAARLAAQGPRGEVVVALDDDGLPCGWATQAALQAAQPTTLVETVLDEHIPEVPPDLPAGAAAARLREQGVEYGFLMHTWPGQPRPAAVVRRRALEERLAEPQ